ncbi:MAG TPA: hypothetical protein VKV77_12545 [Methylovirgula sp.]|nr:hypothetical protein [Methylovirgula sp.]
MYAFNEFAGGQLNGTPDFYCRDLDRFCEQHIPLASEAAQARKRQTQQRLKWVTELWDNPERFDAVVATGRYDRLCKLTEMLSESDERAWQRLRNEILAVRAREFLCAEAA